MDGGSPKFKRYEVQQKMPVYTKLTCKKCLVSDFCISCQSFYRTLCADASNRFEWVSFPEVQQTEVQLKKASLYQYNLVNVR